MASMLDTLTEASPVKQSRSLFAAWPRQVWRVALGIALPLCGFVLWEAAVASGLTTGRLVPPPSRIMAALSQLSLSGELWQHVGSTSLRVLVGFIAGAVAGALAGSVTGFFRVAHALVDPTLQALRAIPSIAWVPLFILWFGIFETSKVALIATGVFFPVYLGVSTALLSVDRKIVEVGHIFRLSGFDLIRRILFPAVLPAFIVSLRAGLGLGWMFVVAAEFMGASEGLGYLLVDGQQLGKPDQILAAIIVFAMIGKLSDALLVHLTAPLVAWQDTFRNGAL
ncbi:aliphatic sulfonates ABC transporter permease protein (plasmid) [Rhizobium gallicum bv. gallicum R602sp]|uniref:Aliphatic sulfonates ABC transporter permease protein n=1 Tax=Rhizobium gallicum bv. gallicum R602sp TaxID=1041138 RepID=A0A0B4XCG3_9HYPH|nr:ABC transporter permease [Rhizobium gallicum]AJD44207.1 aliphatic sulfonates ABC transporter permease protein [Rhizobium gallicum bv. gallicum R602sp]TDW28089.1 sulfonate transport system permease protein [Rhizobium azibense]